MKVIKCDRCKKFLIENDIRVKIYSERTDENGIGRYGSRKSFDLCEDCKKDFDEFMKGR